MAWLLPLCIFAGILYSVLGDCDKASVTTASGDRAPKGKICPGQLIFQDDFNNLDTSVWHHEQTLTGWGNGEFEWYVDDRAVSYAKDGKLHIKPSLTSDKYGEQFLVSGTINLNPCTNNDDNGCHRTGTKDSILNPIRSARMRTDGAFQFKYGRVEVSAKTPTGDWLWPAMWLLPKDWKYGGWPRSGEIDVLESRGNTQLYDGSGRNIGTQLAFSTLHWGPDAAHNKFMTTHYERNNAAGYNTGFHKYELEWTPDHIAFRIDGSEIGRVTPPAGGFWELGQLAGSGLPNPWAGQSKMAPFDQEFYLIINLAVGGTSYFPDDGNKSGKPWKNNEGRYKGMTHFWEGRKQWQGGWNMATDQSHLQVDYVKVWAL